MVANIYRIIFGALIIIAELQYAKLLDWFSFLLTLIGLGGFYIFVGGLALSDQWYAIALGQTPDRQPANQTRLRPTACRGLMSSLCVCVRVVGRACQPWFSSALAWCTAWPVVPARTIGTRRPT